MKKWQVFEAEEYCLKVADGTHDTPKPIDVGEYLITSKHIKDGNLNLTNAYRISVEDYIKINQRSKVEKWDVLISMIGTIGELLLVDHEPNYAIKNIGLFKCGEETKARWLKYYLQSPDGKAEIQSRIGGTTQEYIALGELRKLSIPVPPRPEQKAIASVLSSLDDKIDLLYRQNKTLEAMAETLFRQWFVEEARDDWEEGDLSYFAKNERRSIKPLDIHDKTIYVGLEHIERRNITLKRFGSGNDVTSNKYQFSEGDILFGKLRPYFHKVCFAPFEGVCSTDILVIRPRKTVYFAYCLFAFYQNDVIEYANLGSGGTRMPRTNWEVLSQYPVQIPKDEEISRFNQIVIPMIGKIKQNQNQIRTLEKLRDILLPKLMSGEVRVEYEH